MSNKVYTVEELVLDEGWLDFCLHSDSAYRPYWERIIELNPTQKITFEKAAELIQQLNGNLSEKEIVIQIGKIKSQLHSRSGQPIKDPPLVPAEFLTNASEEKIYSKPFRKFMSVAAGLVLVAGLVVYFILSPGGKKPLQSENIFATTYASKPGERLRIQLPDGSLVLLNSNSSITIKSDFARSARPVSLKGEAFFKVAKDASKPFVVRSENFSTTALGTAFYVHARNPQKKNVVDLLEGKVKLATDKSTLMLAPGEQGTWNNATPDFNKTTFDTSQLDHWISGKISFDKTPWEEAIQQLEKWYAVDIEIRHKQKNKTVTGIYANSSLNDILKVICFSLSCKYRFINDQVIIE